MSEANDRRDHEPVGTAAEEVAKLLGALQDLGSQVGEHIGHGPDCRYCPVCQVINVVRETSPEVRDHLADAAGSLLSALQAWLTPPAGPQQPHRAQEPQEYPNSDQI